MSWLPLMPEAAQASGHASTPGDPTTNARRNASSGALALALVPQRSLPPQGAHALAPLSIRWGGDASSDLLRRSARCTCCGSKGADLQHPSARSSDIGLAFHTRAEDWS